MRRTQILLACLTLLCLAPRTQARAQEATSAIIVTYAEASPARAAALAADLKAYAAQIEASPGKPTITILAELGRPTRMAIIEHWPDVSSPVLTQAATALTAKAQPDALAPLDRRLNHPLTPALLRSPASAFHVLTHVDVGMGTSADALLKAQRDAVLAAPGALGYEVAVQDKRANHFAVHQVWTSRKAYEAYTATPSAQELRRQLAPLIGAPFDDRLFSAASR